ncbi:iron-containing redox enzyme family protein [Streptomyces sp. M10(2022)]
MRSGFRWMLAGLRDWSEALHAELVAAGDPAFDMAELIRLRSREGAVYHHRFMLEGKSLSGWLAECRTDPGPLLDVLARSKLVKPGRSGASSLVRGLVGVRGPMFRVFSPEDLTVLRRWIDSLPAIPADAAEPETSESKSVRAGSPESAATAGPGTPWRPSPEPCGRGALPGHTPSGLREAYHLLMNRTDTPALRPGPWTTWPAGSRAPGTAWTVRRCRYPSAGATRAAALAAGPARPARRGVRGERGDTPSLEGGGRRRHPADGAADADRRQLAPGVHRLRAGLVRDRSLLFETYWDELGNGEPPLNHPLIYRDVLKEMGVELPPTASAAFAQWAGFREESLELPVYWLCVGASRRPSCRRSWG